MRSARRNYKLFLKEEGNEDQRFDGSIHLAADTKLSWRLDKLGKEFSVSLNSIADSGNSIVSFIEGGSEILNLT